MSVHYNVQIHVQRVEKSEVNNVVTRGGEKRDVTEVLDIKVTADSEVEAYTRATRLLAVHAETVSVRNQPAGYANGRIGDGS